MKFMALLHHLLICVLLFLAGYSPKAMGEFSPIPGGEFMMGNSVAADTDIFDAPPRKVTLDAFNMGKYEVSKAEWDRVRTWALANGYTALATGAGKANDHPVHSITWYDMVKWCNARSEMEGLTPVYYVDTMKSAIYMTGIVELKNANVNWDANGYRLPTEAEWEKAARGGLDGKRFPGGDTISHTQANYKANSTYSYQLSYGVNDDKNHPDYATLPMPYTSPVGAFAANGYGLHDVAGNLWEYCWDRYDSTYSGEPNNPRGSDIGNARVLRGGSWESSPNLIRVAYKDEDFPINPYNQYGFRVAYSAKNTSRAQQTIAAFAPIENKTYGDASFSFAVAPPKSSSPLRVSLSVKSGPATISGNTVTITGVGEVILAANQKGNSNYSPATEVTTKFWVISGDRDNDGISDYDENKRGTNPNSNDTDGDGFSDYLEVHSKKTDPKVFNAGITSDLNELVIKAKKRMPRYVVTNNFGAREYRAMGLPLGIKIKKNTGVISGGTRRIGSYKVIITAIKRDNRRKIVQSASEVKIITVK
jgi:formylglycine-generating enzyme required for sulfatase activity